MTGRHCLIMQVQSLHMRADWLVWRQGLMLHIYRCIVSTKCLNMFLLQPRKLIPVQGILLVVFRKLLVGLIIVQLILYNIMLVLEYLVVHWLRLVGGQMQWRSPHLLMIGLHEILVLILLRFIVILGYLILHHLLFIEFILLIGRCKFVLHVVHLILVIR